MVRSLSYWSPKTLESNKSVEGKYIQAAAGVVVAGGAGATSLRNDKGVVINLTGVGQGVDFRLAVSGLVWT